MAMLHDMFHEIGHRVYPLRGRRYQKELGANYFMLLALKKVQLELEPIGFKLPDVDYGEQITKEHGESLKKAQELVSTNTP